MCAPRLGSAGAAVGAGTITTGVGAGEGVGAGAWQPARYAWTPALQAWLLASSIQGVQNGTVMDATHRVVMAPLQARESGSAQAEQISGSELMSVAFAAETSFATGKGG
jgi:hypothetical protein